MKYLNKFLKLFDNYVLARWQNRPSTALFWYLPEPANITTQTALVHYQSSARTPNYLMNYCPKLNYTLENDSGIIVLPYEEPIGKQVNPEAAFQYALGLHDQFLLKNDLELRAKFFKYADYFLKAQTREGLWTYNFDWYAAKKPWSSALAQARGASVMLRAGLLSQDSKYLESAKTALAKFLLPTSEGGFLHKFAPENCSYFEEYPNIPTGVINGFMAALMSIWELNYWLKEKWLAELWELGISSLHKMLPYYTLGWWSLYDRDACTPVANVNSPRYHLLEINYLQVLSVLAESPALEQEAARRLKQYRNLFYRTKALGLKLTRKILYK